LSIALSIALSNLCFAFTVEEFILKPYCSSTNMLLSIRCYILAYISFSNIFE